MSSPLGGHSSPHSHQVYGCWVQRKPQGSSVAQPKWWLVGPQLTWGTTGNIWAYRQSPKRPRKMCRSPRSNHLQSRIPLAVLVQTCAIFGDTIFPSHHQSSEKISDSSSALSRKNTNQPSRLEPTQRSLGLFFSVSKNMRFQSTCEALRVRNFSRSQFAVENAMHFFTTVDYIMWHNNNFEIYWNFGCKHHYSWQLLYNWIIIDKLIPIGVSSEVSDPTPTSRTSFWRTSLLKRPGNFPRNMFRSFQPVTRDA